LFGIHSNHLCGFGAGNGKFEIGIFLPVSKEERVAGEEAVVGISEGSDGLWAGIASESTLLGFGGTDEFLPMFEDVRVGVLRNFDQMVS
jgi:hypothetical protein